MKTIILITILNLVALSTIIAQDINLEMTVGRSLSKLIYDWPEGIANERSSSRSSLNYSFGVSGQIYKFFYLKTELGTNSLLKTIDVEYSDNFDMTSYDFELFGRFRSDQVYIGFYPELRFGEESTVYVNAGFGFYNHYNSRFVNGYRNSTPGPRIDAVDIYNIGGNTSALSINIGVNPKIGNVGIIANVGYSRIKPTKNQRAMPGIGSKQWNFKLGIGYKIGEKKE